VADRLAQLALVERGIGDRIVGKRDLGDLALELRDDPDVLGREPPQHDPVGRVFWHCGLLAPGNRIEPAPCPRSLSPFFRGRGSGEGSISESYACGSTPHPDPLPAKSGERERRQRAGGEGALASCSPHKYNARMGDVSILDTVARATRLREGPA